MEKRSFLQTTVEFRNLHSRPEGGGPAWERRGGKPTKKKSGGTLRVVGTDVGGK